MSEGGWKLVTFTDIQSHGQLNAFCFPLSNSLCHKVEKDEEIELT